MTKTRMALTCIKGGCARSIAEFAVHLAQWYPTLKLLESDQVGQGLLEYLDCLCFSNS